jgi:protein SCO1/2
MQRRTLFAGGAGLFAGAVAVGELTLGLTPAEAHPGHTHIPNTEVVDQDGQKHLFYDDLVKNRVVMINFFFESCGDTCPLTTQNLRQVQDLLGDRMGRDIFMYSITLQPEFDDVASLGNYARLWDVRPGWKFLTGKPAQIEELRKGLGFASSNPAYDRILDNHTGLVRYGNDRLDRWGGVPGLARAPWIAQAVSALADTGTTHS